MAFLLWSICLFSLKPAEAIDAHILLHSCTSGLHLLQFSLFSSVLGRG